MGNKGVEYGAKGDRTTFNTFEFALVICRNPFPDSPDFGKWLAVNETKNRGWWIPAGAVDYGESFHAGALRECKEEAGIDVILKGGLKVDHSVTGDQARMRVIFYAEPTTEDMAKNIKKVADGESLEARWVTLQEIEELAREKPGLRGKELPKWASYLEAGGQI